MIELRRHYFRQRQTGLKMDLHFMDNVKNMNEIPK